MVSKMAERVYCLYRGKDQESILMQKNACHDFAEKKGWNIVDEEQEIGVSGYGKLRMEKETGAFTEKGYVAYCGTLTLGELMAGGPAEQHQRE
uniref:recombinase family protein n=1 Tax=Flavonifractor plautii TaxID=292800 RepID=UPI003BABDBF9